MISDIIKEMNEKIRRTQEILTLLLCLIFGAITCIVIGIIIMLSILIMKEQTTMTLSLQDYEQMQSKIKDLTEEKNKYKEWYEAESAKLYALKTIVKNML